MSHYTNDIDTLRQLVSQAIPAFIQSGAIVLVVFSIMLYFSVWLTLVVLLGIALMFIAAKRLGRGLGQVFHGPTEVRRCNRGLHSGDDERPAGHKGFLPRAREHRGF